MRWFITRRERLEMGAGSRRVLQQAQAHFGHTAIDGRLVGCHGLPGTGGPWDGLKSIWIHGDLARRNSGGALGPESTGVEPLWPTTSTLSFLQIVVYSARCQEQGAWPALEALKALRPGPGECNVLSRSIVDPTAFVLLGLRDSHGSVRPSDPDIAPFSVFYRRFGPSSPLIIDEIRVRGPPSARVRPRPGPTDPWISCGRAACP